MHAHTFSLTKPRILFLSLFISQTCVNPWLYNFGCLLYLHLRKFSDLRIGFLPPVNFSWMEVLQPLFPPKTGGSQRHTSSLPTNRWKLAIEWQEQRRKERGSNSHCSEWGCGNDRQQSLQSASYRNMRHRLNTSWQSAARQIATSTSGSLKVLRLPEVKEQDPEKPGVIRESGNFKGKFDCRHVKRRTNQPSNPFV